MGFALLRGDMKVRGLENNGDVGNVWILVEHFHVLNEINKSV